MILKKYLFIILFEAQKSNTMIEHSPRAIFTNYMLLVHFYMNSLLFAVLSLTTLETVYEMFQRSLKGPKFFSLQFCAECERSLII